MTTNARLRAFVAVAETGSVRAAAKQLCLTESAVSAAITTLGKDVGIALFTRHGRGIRLTDAGSTYAGHARTILGLHEQAVSAARDRVRPDKGLVRIAAVTTAGEHVLPRLLASFRARYPTIGLRLEVAPKDQVWPMLTHHEVDMVVAGAPPESASGRVRAVSPNTLVVVGSPERAGEFRPELASWLMREEGSGTRATCLALLAALDIDPAQMTLGAHGAVVAAAAAGLGVTLVSRQAVAEQLAAADLVELPVAGTPLDRPWHAVTHDDCTASTELLIRHLLSEREQGWRPAQG